MFFKAQRHRKQYASEWIRMINDYLRIGVITAPHGVRGEVKVFPTTDDPERFDELETVWLYNGKSYVSLDVESVKYFKNMVILKVKQIPDRNEAEKYRSKELYVDREHALPLEEITSKDVYDAAVQGDRLGNEVFAFTGRLLGESCADFATFSDPEAFIFFGGLTKAGDLLMNPIVKTYNETVFDNYKGTARFLISQLKDAEAALLGAAALAWTDR